MKATFLEKVLATTPDSLNKEFVFDFLRQEITSSTSELPLIRLCEYCFMFNGYLNTLSPMDYLADDWAKIQKMKVLLHRIKQEVKQHYEYIR
jgi:hypothetical protein